MGKIVEQIKSLKTIGLGLLSFLCVIGAVNGVGYSIYIHQWPTAICVVPLAVCAAFTLVSWWKKELKK